VVDRVREKRAARRRNDERKHVEAIQGVPTLSLFSGAGGLDLGFLEAGYDIRACVEIEHNYCQTLRANVGGNHRFGGETVIHEKDIRKFDASQYRSAGIRCVVGGPPCQTFSAAGRRAGGVIGTKDSRGQLFEAYCDVLDELNPEVFVFENVYGLPGANGGRPFKEICDAFSSRGYKLSWEVVDAADYGVPQHRERLIMVGSRGRKFVFPQPTHGPDSASGRPLTSVLHAIEDLQDPDEPFHDDLGGMYGHLLPQVPEGLNYAYFTAEMKHPAPVFAWRSKFHDLLYKVDRNAPCRTIKAQPGKFTGPFHWKNRHFTTAELKRLQTFPDDYELQGSRGIVLEQIGNSVPPALAAVIATAVREQLLEPTEAQTYPVRPEGFKSTFRVRQRERSAHFHEVAKAANAALAHDPGHKLQGQSGSYFVTHQGLFDRRRHSSGHGLPGNALEIRITEGIGHVDLEVRRMDGADFPESRIEISGLRKYLPGYDSLSASAFIGDLAELFQVWSAIEDALTARSRFFTLIDIYGHYANRGDTVQIEARWKLPLKPNLLAAINFFGSTGHCGGFIDVEELMTRLGVQEPGLREVIKELRRVRFDARTHETHPIIEAGKVLCTYPFPLLSPRALVESRAQLAPSREARLEFAQAS
jgi:DNA (cytosine-5)-methyltransferase 1